MNIKERIAALRELMVRENMDAYIVYSPDPHGSEYVDEHWRARAWISGFTGSAGTFVVTKDRAGIWTDFRYYIQASAELAGTGVELFKMGMPGVPAYSQWLACELGQGAVVGVDGRTMTVKDWEGLAALFSPKSMMISGKKDLIGEVWTDRPASIHEAIWQQSTEEAGESRKDKLGRVFDALRKQGADHYLISSLDDIAWLLNIRGEDVPYNPVVRSYLLLSGDSGTLFMKEDCIGTDIKADLASDGIGIAPYEDVCTPIAALPSESVLYISAEKTNSLVASSVPDGVKVIKGMDITSRLKGQKNNTEQKLIRRAMEQDGVAMSQFLKWLVETIQTKNITEIEAAEQLKEFRAKQPGFLMESFCPIPGYQENGALCHYKAEAGSEATMTNKGLFLIDSGGQYREGTTDITRTVALGEATQLEKEDYTLVLKGHVNLARVKFPKGTRGYQLDTLARLPLWEQGLNYGHGTGHGVGFVLNVHEGPQSISPKALDEAIELGQVTSNEPGLYREGIHGIRIENLVLTVPWAENPGSDEFYAFEDLTLCPYDRKLIEVSLLTDAEREWIDAYHAMVWDRLSPLMSGADLEWLKQACCAL